MYLKEVLRGKLVDLSWVLTDVFSKRTKLGRVPSTGPAPVTRSPIIPREETLQVWPRAPTPEASLRRHSSQRSVINKPDLPTTRGRTAGGQADGAHLAKPSGRFQWFPSRAGRQARERLLREDRSRSCRKDAEERGGNRSRDVS